jgi:hypothetical protein
MERRWSQAGATGASLEKGGCVFTAEWSVRTLAQ